MSVNFLICWLTIRVTRIKSRAKSTKPAYESIRCTATNHILQCEISTEAQRIKTETIASLRLTTMSNTSSCCVESAQVCNNARWLFHVTAENDEQSVEE